MDMSEFTRVRDLKEARLRRHLKGLRENQISVALIMLELAGYRVTLDYVGEPNASAAKEILDELEDPTSVWSCSTKDGGVWETWQRDAMKYGDLTTTNSWNVWKTRKGL